jgi:hypothetical protein
MNKFPRIVNKFPQIDLTFSRKPKCLWEGQIISAQANKYLRTHINVSGTIIIYFGGYNYSAHCTTFFAHNIYFRAHSFKFPEFLYKRTAITDSHIGRPWLNIVIPHFRALEVLELIGLNFHEVCSNPSLYGCPFEEITPTFQSGCAEIYLVRENICTVRRKVVIPHIYIIYVPEHLYECANILACAEILSLAAETYSPCAETYSPMRGNLFTVRGNLCAARKYFQVPANFFVCARKLLCLVMCGPGSA